MKKLLKKFLFTGLMVTALFNTLLINAQTQDNDLKLWYNYMAGTNFSGDPNDIGESFYKALPSGNGRIGAMVYGNYPDERIDLNESTFWSSGPGNNNKAGAANSLKTAQDQLFAGQYRNGDSTIGNMIGGGEAKYQSVGNLKLAFGHSTVSGYSRQLDMNTGVISCDYTYNGKTYHRESFVSYPDQVLVTRITCGSTGSVSFTATYECSLSGQYTVSTSSPDTLIMNGHGDSDNGVNYAVWFSTRTKIINTNGSVSAGSSSVTVTNADSVVILTSVRTNFINYTTCNGDEKGKATTDIANASAKSYTTLYNAHVADYQTLFKRVDVDLGGSGSENSKPMNTRISQFGSNNDPKLVKVLFQYGRYLMITASRDSQPMNLQGIWNKFRNPAWGCKMTTNINYEMNYWPALTTNLAECFVPFVEKAKALQTPGNATARVHYNISNGWVLHHNTDLWNRCAPIDGVWGFWPTGAGWISNMLYDAYNFNQDTSYLNDVYPVIKGAADFLQTLMQSHSINGQNYQVVCPGTSPEVATPGGSGGQGAFCSYGVTMDNGICRELFKGVIQASNILNVDAAFRSTLQSKVSQIKPDTIGSWGQIQEWAYDWDSQNETNRHISHMYNLFPGMEMSKRRTPTITNAAIVSLQKRGDVGTGWSEAWKLNCWARLEDGSHAYNLVKLLITPANSSGRLYDNLWDAHPPFQIDGNFGFTSGITEMLLQSHNNEIQLLPALPGQWSTGHANGLRARGNFTITQLNWANGVLSSVYITSHSGNPCTVRYGNTTISFQTTAGGTYQLNGSLQLAGSSTALSNVALNKTVTASGNASGEEPSRAVDGSTATKWGHNNGISGEWLKVDLGDKYDISRWVVKHAGVTEAIRFNTRDFTLQQSADGNTWSDVDAAYGNVQNISDRNVPTFTTRYARLYINTATQDTSGGARIYEWELWGKLTGTGITPTPTPTPTPTGTTGPTPTPNQNPIWSGGPYTLNGTSDYADLPDGLTGNLHDFSIACWVKLNSLDNWSRIFDFGGDTNVFMMLTPKSGSTGFPYFAITISGNSGEQGIDGNGTLETGSWQHLAVVKSGNTGILYINKQEAGRNTGITLSPADLGNTLNNYIGRSQWSNDPYLNGSVDKFVVYDRALSAAEVTTLGSNPPGMTASGDADGSGAVDIVDALMTAQYSVGLTPAGFIAANADVNCDGTITIVDALMIAQYYVGLINKFC